VTTIDRVVQVVLTLDQRGSRHLDEAGKVQRIETSEPLDDVAGSRGRSLPKLIAQPLVS
jgi:hypothetical protein